MAISGLTTFARQAKAFSSMSGIALPLAVIMNFASSFASDKLLADLVGKTGSDYFKMYLVSD